jgi:hypothetical protein
MVNIKIKIQKKTSKLLNQWTIVILELKMMIENKILKGEYLSRIITLKGLWKWQKVVKTNNNFFEFSNFDKYNKNYN